MCDGITAEALVQKRREDETGGSVRENAGDLGERELLRIPTAQQIPIPQGANPHSALSVKDAGEAGRRVSLVSGYQVQYCFSN